MTDAPAVVAAPHLGVPAAQDHGEDDEDEQAKTLQAAVAVSTPSSDGPGRGARSGRRRPAAPSFQRCLLRTLVQPALRRYGPPGALLGAGREVGIDVPLTTRPLDASTWDAFAELVERNNGVYGGCWCIVQHPQYVRGVSDPRTLKRQLVHQGDAHAALVLDEAGRAQGWCQYGTRDELLLKHRREYDREPPAPSTWRIACLFVDRGHRRQGVARAALQGALGQIAAAGGGLVEAVSETTRGRTAQDRFLFSATVELFEDLDFSRIRQVGKHAWIVSRTVGPA